MPALTDAEPYRVLKTVFGFDEFRPHQEEIIRRILDGGNALVIMPTGGGKSLCYQLPALLLDGTGIVISPLIALMEDQVAALQQLGVEAACLNSSIPREKQQRIEDRLLDGRLDLLYVAPERAMTGYFQRLLSRIEPALFAIDEVHCMSQWGHDFRPDYLQIATLRERFPHIPCIAVTATADTETQQDLLRLLNFNEGSHFVTGFDRPNIHYSVTVKRNPKRQLLHFIRDTHPGEAGIVYCLSRKKVERTATWLKEEGIRALPYHAGLSDVKRSRHQERFLREDGVVIVATVAFGMGIDKPDVRFVAHLDLPKNLEAYYQETGRAGRDGLPAHAWMAYRYSDVVRMRKLMEGGASEERQWIRHHKLNDMLGFCESAQCRRKVLLEYFSDSAPDRCGNCDTCDNPVETWDGTVASQKVLSCVARTGQRFGAGHITDVLLGRDTKKIRQHGHEQLSTYGIGDELNKSGWTSVVRQLVAANLLRVDVAGYGALHLSEQCSAVLRGDESVRLRRDTHARAPATSTRRSRAPELPDSPEAEALFEALRQKRTELADQQDVPPYVVFADRTLIAMVKERPQTRADFARLHGVGSVKLKRYADEFLPIVRGDG